MISLPKDSKQSLDWLARACAQNPVTKIMDPTTGAFTGNYSTGPVRLSFPHLFEKHAVKDGQRATFNAAFLFPPGVDTILLQQAVNEVAIGAFKSNMTPQGFVWYGLKSPFHDQAEKALKYKGYTPGATYFGSSSEFKPRVVDPNMNDIIDVGRVYPGVWAIAAVNPYSFDNVSKGVSLGLQSVMIIADDENIGGGGAVDPRQAFAGIRLDATVNVSAAFGVPGAAVPGAAPIGETSMDALRRMGLL